MADWQQRIGESKTNKKIGATVNALLKSIDGSQLKLENLEAVRRRKVTFEGFHVINFGAIQLDEPTIRSIARECGIESLLRVDKRDKDHISIRRFSLPANQLYTQRDDPHCGTQVEIKKLKDVKPHHLRGIANFCDEIQRLREGIIEMADERIQEELANPSPKPAPRARRVTRHSGGRGA